MTIESIRQLYDARPFRPFILHLADGRRTTIHHPEFLAFSPDDRTLVAFQPDRTMKIIDLELVTELEVKPNRTPRKAA